MKNLFITFLMTAFIAVSFGQSIEFDLPYGSQFVVIELIHTDGYGGIDTTQYYKAIEATQDIPDSASDFPIFIQANIISVTTRFNHKNNSSVTFHHNNKDIVFDNDFNIYFPISDFEGFPYP